MMRLQAEITELKHLETENFKIQKEVGKIQGEKNDLEYQIKSLKVQIQDLKSQITNPQRVLDPIISDKELRELKQQLDLKDEKIASLLAKLDSIEQQATTISSKRPGSESRRGSRTQDTIIEDLREEIEILKKDRNRLKKKVQDLNTENEDLDNQISQLQLQLKKRLEDVQGGETLLKLEEKIGELKKENQKFAEKNDELKKKVKEQKAKLKKVKSQPQTATQDIPQKHSGVFNGSFSQEKQAPREDMKLDAPLPGPKHVADSSNNQTEIKSGTQGQTGQNSDKTDTDQKDEIIEDLKVKMFVMAAENERLIGIHNGRVLSQHGSSRRIVPQLTAIQNSPNQFQLAPEPQQTFSRSPDPSLKYIVNTSPYKAPVIIKQSQVSNFPSFAGSPSKHLIRPNFKYNMLQTVPWDSVQSIGPMFEDESRARVPVLFGPSMNKSNPSNNILLQDLQNVISRYSEKKISDRALPDIIGSPQQESRRSALADRVHPQPFDPLQLDYASTSPIRLKTPPKTSDNVHSNPVFHSISNPLQQSYDKHIAQQQQEKLNPLSLKLNIHQHPVLSGGFQTNSQIPRSQVTINPLSANFEKTEQRPLSNLSLNYKQAPQLSYPSQGSHQTRPQLSLINPQYFQPSINDDAHTGELIPQPKKETSMKNSDLSYGTVPLSDRTSRHPYAESVGNNLSASGNKQNAETAHVYPQVYGMGQSPSFGTDIKINGLKQPLYKSQALLESSKQQAQRCKLIQLSQRILQEP